MDPASAKQVANVAIALLKESGLIEQVTDFLLRKEQYTIIVLGASGTGKTSFCRRLRGLTTTIPRQIRSKVSDAVKGKLHGELKVKFIETPGQIKDPFTIHRQRSIAKAVNEKRLGILNVVSYGYHEGDIAEEIALTKQNLPREKFLANRRYEELLLLEEWRDKLCRPAGGPADWLITVCSKADLWWTPKNWSQIIGYYESGDYFDSLGLSRNIDTTALSFSSHDQLFYDTVRMSGFYTESKRREDEATLIARILANCQRVPA
jgi:hypothetical protein